jgi:hypothetical protein
MALASSVPATYASGNKLPLDHAELAIATSALGKPLPRCTPRQNNPCWLRKLPTTNALVDRFGIDYSLTKGVVSSITIGTAGVRFQDRELEMLISVFGRPSDFKETTVQNLFGARLPKIEASWSEATTRSVDLSSNPGPSLPIYVSMTLLFERR